MWSLSLQNIFFWVSRSLYIHFQAKKVEVYFSKLVFSFVAIQIHKFIGRFQNIPDMLELDHLTVSGDVTFGNNVTLKVGSFTPLVCGSYGLLSTLQLLGSIFLSFWSNIFVHILLAWRVILESDLLDSPIKIYGPTLLPKSGVRCEKNIPTQSLSRPQIVRTNLKILFVDMLRLPNQKFGHYLVFTLKYHLSCHYIWWVSLVENLWAHLLWLSNQEWKRNFCNQSCFWHTEMVYNLETWRDW